ncbi:MAG: cupin domain-containing protein [Eubacteriales bacterium]
MYYANKPNPCPYYMNSCVYKPRNRYYDYRTCPNPYWICPPMSNPYLWEQYIELKDYGPNPFVVNIDKATKQNNNYRTALWTGDHLQLTLMSIDPGEDIGLEIHPHLDQFIRIEAGQGMVEMGDTKENLNFRSTVYEDFAFIIPAGKWHNLVNTGNKPLKLYSIYAPPQHPHGTVHKTKVDAQASE